MGFLRWADAAAILVSLTPFFEQDSPAAATGHPRDVLLRPSLRGQRPQTGPHPKVKRAKPRSARSQEAAPIAWERGSSEGRSSETPAPRSRRTEPADPGPARLVTLIVRGSNGRERGSDRFFLRFTKTAFDVNRRGQFAMNGAFLPDFQQPMTYSSDSSPIRLHRQRADVRKSRSQSETNDAFAY